MNEAQKNITNTPLYKADSVQDAIDARRYRYLRERDLDTIESGGIFAGSTPDNVVVNGADLDRRVDDALAAEDKIQRMMRALARTVGVKRSRGDEAIVNDEADGEDAIAINCRDLVKFYEGDGE